MSVSFGHPRRHLRITDSTNERARVLVKAGAPSGTVVTAAEQTAGRGRSGRRWSAPAGSALLATAILRPLTERHRLLPLAVPLAVCEAIEGLAPVECAIKWPNDVWVEERKVAGRPDRGSAAAVGPNRDGRERLDRRWRVSGRPAVAGDLGRARGRGRDGSSGSCAIASAPGSRPSRRRSWPASAIGMRCGARDRGLGRRRGRGGGHRRRRGPRGGDRRGSHRRARRRRGSASPGARLDD